MALSGMSFCIWELVRPAVPCAAPARPCNHGTSAPGSLPTVARMASAGVPLKTCSVDARSLPRHLSLDPALLLPAAGSRRSIDHVLDANSAGDHGVDYRPSMVDGCFTDDQNAEETVFALDLAPCGRPPKAICQWDVLGRVSSSSSPDGNHTMLSSDLCGGGPFEGVASFEGVARRESQRQLLVHT